MLEALLYAAGPLNTSAGNVWNEVISFDNWRFIYRYLFRGRILYRI